MADKSVPQLTAVTSTTSGDLYHVVRSSIDYKIDYDYLASSIRGGTTASTTFYASATMTTAELLAGFTTAKIVVAAPSALYAIEVISATASVTYNSAAYATNTSLILYTDTATDNQFEFTSFLASTVTNAKRGILQGSGGAATLQIIAGKPLYLKVKTGNPITGNSDIKVYVSYRLITL